MTTPTSRAPRARAKAPGTDPAAATIDSACRVLQLPTIRDTYEDTAAVALTEHASYKQFLASLLTAEIHDRGERRKIRLVREAGFPRPKRLEDFDFDANPNISPAAVGTLADPAWVTAGQPLCLLGDSGTGKSHLLIGIGTAIAEAGLKVRYSTTANLVNELVEAADERQLSKHITRYSKVDLVCLDVCRHRDYAEPSPA